MSILLLLLILTIISLARTMTATIIIIASVLYYDGRRHIHTALQRPYRSRTSFATPSTTSRPPTRRRSSYFFRSLRSIHSRWRPILIIKSIIIIIIVQRVTYPLLFARASAHRGQSRRFIILVVVYIYIYTSRCTYIMLLLLLLYIK